MLVSLLLVACSSDTQHTPPEFESPIELPPRRAAPAADGGSSVDAGTQDGRAPVTVPCPTTPGLMSVTIDGVAMTVEEHELWAPNPIDRSAHDLFIRFHGPGVGAGTDIAIRATRIGDGCDPSVNMLTYRPAGDSQAFPGSTPTCGLRICALPDAASAHLTGAFQGTLVSSGATPRTRTVAIAFDAARAP